MGGEEDVEEPRRSKVERFKAMSLHALLRHVEGVLEVHGAVTDHSLKRCRYCVKVLEKGQAAFCGDLCLQRMQQQKIDMAAKARAFEELEGLDEHEAEDSNDALVHQGW